MRGQLKDTQLELSNWWHNEVTAMLTIIHGRRGLGKTWWFLTEGFAHMAQNPGHRLIYAAPTREEVKKIVLPTSQVLIPHWLPSEVRPRWRPSDHLFEHPNGATMVLEGADDDMGDHLRGPFAHRAFLDELGFWRHAEYVYRSVIFPQVKRVKGRMLGASTSPQTPGHEFAAIIIPEARRDGAYRKFTIDDDYTLTQTEKDEYAAQYDPENRDPAVGRKKTAYQREFECKIVIEAERAVLPEFDASRHVHEIVRPEFFDGYLSLDLGMVDLTHVIFAYYHFDKATIVVENEIVRQYTPVSELAPLISAMEVDLWKEQSPMKRIADNHPMEIAEFSRQHILQPDKVSRELRFSAAENRNPEALLNRARSMLVANRIVINPACKRLIAQCEQGLWNKARTDFEKTPDLGHLDGVMALAYLVDGIDYATNPNLRARLNPETHAIYTQKKPEVERYGKLQQLLPPAARRTH